MKQTNIGFRSQLFQYDENFREASFANFLDDLTAREEVRRSLEEKEMSHEKSLWTCQFDSQIPRTIESNVAFFLPEEPLLFIEIIQSKIPIQHISNRFIVTPRGMLYSLRKVTDGDVTIGRQQVNEYGVRPNDIMLHPRDSSISRVHCRIIYKDGLLTKTNVPSEFQAFCMMNHKRLGMFSPGKKIPKSIFRIIFEFLRERKRIIIEDLGSVYGTYIKIREEEEIIEPCTILLGNEAVLSVLGFYSSGFEYLTSRLGVSSFEISKNQVSDLINTVFDGSESYFLGFSDIFEHPLETLKCPIIKLCIDNCHPCSKMLNDKIYTVVVPNQKGCYTFTIGPELYANIRIPRASSSVEFIYRNSRWYIKESINSFLKSGNLSFSESIPYGVWRSVSGTKFGKDRYSQGATELKNGDEVKVSETVFKVSWQGCSKLKRNGIF